jgi:uncharacterized protein YcbK (DUF882 family)
MDCLSRRQFLSLGGGAACALLLSSSPSKSIVMPRSLNEKWIHLYNTHTGEFFRGPFWAAGRYLEESIKQLNKFFRDWRTNEELPIDFRLFEAIHALKSKIGCSKAFDMISGYRSPHTNKMLSQKTNGVAKKSLHMEGRAIDIRFRGDALKKAHRIACALKMGGVGLYPKSQDRFIHIDVRPRIVHWVG